ncbi:MAG: hypothetical protein GXO87_03135 [Chlorobi bacterium]|nr:hypothetical protein [Chlorobiota bacterium]
MKKTLLKYFLFGLFTAALFPAVGTAQIDMTKGSFLHPTIMTNGEYKHEFSIVLAKLPEDQVEAISSWIYAPLFAYRAKYGLPYGFNLKGSVSTNIITFQFRAGPQWGYDFGKVTLSLNPDVAYWFGQLNQFGFNSKVNAWSGYLSLLLGIEFEKFTLTLGGETEHLFSVTQKADDIETSITKNLLVGYSFSIVIEQPVWGDNFMTLGVKFNYSRFYWPAWAVFPTWDRFNFLPEVIVGFVL